MDRDDHQDARVMPPQPAFRPLSGPGSPASGPTRSRPTLTPRFVRQAPVAGATASPGSAAPRPRRPAFTRFAAALEATDVPALETLEMTPSEPAASAGAAPDDDRRRRAHRFAVLGLAAAAVAALMAWFGFAPGEDPAPAALARGVAAAPPADALAAGPLLAAFRLPPPVLEGAEARFAARAAPSAGAAQAAVRGVPAPLHFGGAGPRLVSGAKLASVAGIARRALARPVAEDSNPLYDLGYRLQRKGESASAIEAYRLAAESDPQHAATFYNWGYLLQQQGDPARAAAKYRQTLQLAPRHAFAHYNLAWLLQKAGDEAAAIEHYHAAIAANPNFAWSHYNLGWLEQKQGHDQEALADYRRSLELDPQLALAHENIAAILRHHE